MTTTPRHSLSSCLSLKLVNYFIRYRAHINTFKTNCITICIANGAAARNSVATVATSLNTTPFGLPLQAPVYFLSLDFQFLHFYSFLLFFNRCSLFVHPAPVTHSGTSSTARLEVVPTPTSQMTATPRRGVTCDLLLCSVRLL
jgi:hypothetical protein